MASLEGICSSTVCEVVLPTGFFCLLLGFVAHGLQFVSEKCPKPTLQLGMLAFPPFGSWGLLGKVHGLASACALSAGIEMSSLLQPESVDEAVELCDHRRLRCQMRAQKVLGIIADRRHRYEDTGRCCAMVF